MAKAPVIPCPGFVNGIHLLDVLQRLYMRARAYLNPVRDSETMFGAVIRCNARDFVQRRIQFFRIFEHDLTYYTLSRLREGDVYVDIGANVGYYTLLASRAVGPAGKVISVEADPSTFGELTDNINRNCCENVMAYNVAATATACHVRIERGDSRNIGSNSVKIAAAGCQGVKGLPFCDIVQDDLSRVRFVKIDIEGSEAPVLSAILERLHNLSDDLIVASEVSPTSAGFVSRFVAAGFRAYAIQNIYTIDYYLIRSYLRRFGLENYTHLVPVTEYVQSYSDYIFERCL